MARKKFDDYHENHERWLISYADFITLLLGFFVVMYAVSTVKESKYRALSESIGTAFGKERPPYADQFAARATAPLAKPVVQNLSRAEARRDERKQLSQLAAELREALAPLVEQGQVKVTESGRGVTVEINASVLFAPAEAGLSPQASRTLTAVAAIMRTNDHTIRVEGHSDNIPIRTAVFPSNWELSAARAGSVVRLFAEHGLAEHRMVAVGHGANRPLASNETPAGRQRNRRVQLVVMADLTETEAQLPAAAH